MGYYADGYGTITFKHLSEDEIREVVKNLNFEDCATICDCMREAFNAEVYNEESEAPYITYSIYACEKYWNNDVTKFLQAIEPYTVEGEIEYVGEDQRLWRFHFRNNRWYLDVGHVEYVNTETPLFIPYGGQKE